MLKMRYKHIVTVGTILIAVFILLAALMYYFNQDICHPGTFPCKNSDQCLPQREWCDGREDCPEGDDEDLKCFDIYFNDWYYNQPKPICLNDSGHYILHSRAPVHYKNCNYGHCAVVCSHFDETKIPEAFSEHIVKLTLQHTTMPVLKKNYFRRYPKLFYLFLHNGNRIKKLEQNVFVNQSELIWLVMSKNKIEEILAGQLEGLVSLILLALEDNRIHTFDLIDLENSTSLEAIDLSGNLLTSSNLSLPFLPNLKELDLDENHLEIITDDMFSRLPTLQVLKLENNLIRIISSNAFKNLEELRDLNLTNNRITLIPPNLFCSTLNLLKLSIGFNPIKNLSAVSLKPLKSNLTSLNVQDIEIKNMEKNLFDMFTQLTFAYFKNFHYCTAYAPNVRICKPAGDGVSSLTHLLGKPVLRAAVWGISCVTCLGNALVLWGRFTAKDENRVLSIMIRNLAVGDLLMGIYLFIIGLEDIRFRDNYYNEANEWMSSWSCTFIGMLAMTSSEVSVLILSFMSVERFMLIAAPLKGHRAITPQTAASSMIVVWVIGITLALIPAIHWRSSTRFYGLNGMCFPLHIDDPFLVGWEYSAFIFLGLNLLGLVTIGYAYVGMFASIWRTRHATPLSIGDSEFALRFFLIVLTDAICWAPIVILKIMALSDYPVATDLHAWVVIFILPVNSAVNPLLYTFTTPKFRERLNEGWFGKVRNIISRRQSRSDSQTSNSYTNKSVMLSLPSTGPKMPVEEKRLQPVLKVNLLKAIIAFPRHQW